jgi:radical SAM superfamily enzyme YgiQ (UPF0313 family)
LLSFLQELDSSKDFSKIDRLVYRDGDQILVGKNKSMRFFDFNKGSILPDFDDFFNCIKKINFTNEIYLPIETSRGCHWRKCNFCYLNQGYKYRQISPEKIVDSLIYLYNKYNVKSFSFLDNDLIGNDIKKFSRFLNLLIIAKENGYDFHFLNSEIITFELNAEIVKQMSLAGFENIQIGYEAISDSILRKMNKKQSVADNICCIKFSLKYGINILGANIISQIIDETDEDILESIENLHFLRFFLKTDKFIHDVVFLELTEYSKYFKMVPKEELDQWKVNSITTYLTPLILENINRFRVFGYQKIRQKELWLLFKKATENYIAKDHNYKLLVYNKLPIFKEYIENKEIKSITFDEPLYWEIMVIANFQAVSFNDILVKLNENGNTCSESQLKSILINLKNEYLVYFNESMSKIISIIDTSIIS